MSPQEGRPSAGDFTGQEKARAAKEQAQVSQERAAEVSMATTAQSETERVGVFDAQSGELLEDPTRSAVMVEERPAPGFFRPTEEPALTGRETDEELAVILANRAERPAPTRERAVSPMVTVRIDQDVDKMTYGMHNGEPNNFTFKEGLQYKIPREVADHLEERGLIRQWMTH